MTYNPPNRRYDRGSFNQPTPAHKDGFKRSPLIVDANTKPRVTELWGFPDPAPPVWRVEGIMREGYFSLVAANAGSGKSFLALNLAFCAALGRSFFGRQTKRSRVLYVDYEMDADEQKRRLSRIASGHGMTVHDERLRDHLYYHRAKNPLSTDAGVAEIEELVECYDIDFIVIDSLTFSLGAADASASKDVVPVLLWLQALGISGLILDHFSKSAAQGNQAFATPFGSTMKFAVARSVFNLTRMDGGGLLLQATKMNFGPSPDALSYDMVFEGDLGPITFKQVDRADPAMAGATEHLRAHDVTLVGIEAVYSETNAPVSQRQVVDWRIEQGPGLELSLRTVQNHFSKLVRDGLISRHATGGYAPTTATRKADVRGGEASRDEAPHTEVAEAERSINAQPATISIEDIFGTGGTPDNAAETPFSSSPSSETIEDEETDTPSTPDSDDPESITKDEAASERTRGLDDLAQEGPEDASTPGGSAENAAYHGDVDEENVQPVESAKTADDPFVHRTDSENDPLPEHCLGSAA